MSLNRRSSAVTASGTVFFHYDGASARVLAETDLLGSVLASYTYDDAGQLHSMSREGATYYYHLNARGDVVALTDGTGGVVNTYSYDPWGQLLSADETVSNPYRYASYRYDTESGLYYCWNRYYAPELARFITRDIYPGELADPVSMNPYLYCAGDPVNFVDPSGMAFLDVVTGALGTLFSLAAGFAAAAESPVLATAFGVGATGLIIETPIASAVAYGMYSRPTLEDDIATAESWEQASAEARAAGRCDAADQMDTLRLKTIQDLKGIRNQAMVGIVGDVAVAIFECIVGRAGFRAVRF